MTKKIYIYSNLFAWTLVLLIAANYVLGWTTPSEDPPGGNIVLSQGALPSGSAGYVQFASSSTAFGGDAGLFWDNTNKRLGIGTTTPGVLLNMWGANATLRIQASSANQQAGIQLYDTTTQAWNIYKTADANNDLQFYSNTGGGMVMTVKGSSGNVGIGTTGPGQKLDVVENIRASGTLLANKFKAGEGYSGSVTADNWYRIASNSGNRANAEFTLRDYISSGGHSTLTFRLGISYNDESDASFTVLNHNIFSIPTFTKVRYKRG